MHTSVLYVDYNKQRTMFLELWKDSEQKIRHCFLSDSRYIYYLDQNSNFTKCSQYEYTEVTNSTNDEVCFQSHMCTCFFEKQGLFYILRAWVRFFRVHLPKKRAFYLLAPPKQVLFFNHF